MEEAEDEPLFCERAAGIDIGKRAIMVTVRVPSERRQGGRRQETREFGTTRRQLLALAGWLRSWGVERAGMEGTSDYWKPAFFTLEREGIDCVLYQASQVKALPGRPKTDRQDSAWLAKVTERGSRSPAMIAFSMSRPETPWTSLITLDSFRCASSSSFSARCFSAVRAWVSRRR